MKKTKGVTIWITMLVLIFVFWPIRGQAAEAEENLKITLRQGSSASQIQQALNQAKNLDLSRYKCVEVRLEKGTYLLSEDLLMYSNTTLITEDCRLIKGHKRGPMIRNKLYDQEKEKPYAENLKVIGGIWDAGSEINKANSDETFRFIHAKNVEVRNLTIKNVRAGHLLTLAGVEGAVVDHCTLASFSVYGTTKEALHLDLVHSKYMVPVVDSSKPLIRYDDAPCKDITVTNCNFYNVPAGVGSHSSVRGVFQENIVIKDNTFTNIESSAVRCYNYKNVTISGNKMIRVGIGVQLYTGTKNSDVDDDNKTSYHIPLKGTEWLPIPKDNDYHIQIENNFIQTVYKGKENRMGVGISVAGTERRPIARLKILNNTILNTKKHSMLLTYAPAAVIINNKLANPDLDGYIGGIRVEHSDACKVEQNEIRYCERAMDISQSPNGEYDSNRITNSLYDGIRLSNKSSNSCIKKNQIKDTAGTAITIEDKSESTKVIKNQIDTAHIGIYIKDSPHTKLKQNTLTGQFRTKIQS